MESVMNVARAADMAGLIQQLPEHIKVLSLDCFDTLLWRRAATASDVFFDLQNQPVCRQQGINPRLRINAEKMARQIKLVQAASNEVTLEEIYQLGFKGLSQSTIASIIQEEIQLEKNTLYAFPPAIDLIQQAHARGLKIILVSDTYFTEPQLRDLLSACMAPEILALIHKIFVSSQYGYSKTYGLFKCVSAEMQVEPEKMLHLGDHQKADYDAPRKLGMHAIHMMHHAPEIFEILRMQATSACMFDPSIRNKRAFTNPLRGVLALDQEANASPEYSLGYATIGPILYAFARFICAQLENQPIQTKVVFLMRDAYLPSLCCEFLTGKEVGKRVRISRFVAQASSFRTLQDIEQYIADKIATKRYEDLGKQLLLPPQELDLLLKKLAVSENPGVDFIRYVHQEHIINLIINNSKAYFERLKHYLKKAVDLQPNDKLIFIDLGYTGSAQNKLTPLFQQDMNVELNGLYLLALNNADMNSKRKSLLNSNHFDDKSLIMLVTYIALLEQICTTAEKSVVDYASDGTPIYTDVTLSADQNQKLARLQAECLRFIQTAKSYFPQSIGELRDAAAANLTRLIFFPTKNELAYLQHFEFDFNLGMKEVLPVFDINKGITGLRRRSWLHCAKESMKNMRTNYPAEWRATSLELSIALMAQHRFGLEFALHDLSHRREPISILAILDGALTPLNLDATPTYDGYFALLVPVVHPQCQLAIKLGERYQWVELESAELIKMTALYTYLELEQSLDASPYLAVDQIADKGGGLFECQSDASLLVFTPPSTLDNDRHILRLVFRPVVTRQTAQAAVA